MILHPATVFSSPMQALRRMVAIFLAVLAIGVGAFALHPIAGTHSASIPSIADATELATAQGTLAMTANNATVSTAGWIGPVSTVAACDSRCAVDCAVLVAGCGILAVLVALVFLTRYPALFTRLKDSGRRIRQLIPEAQGHVYLPSLTFLSISRI